MSSLQLSELVTFNKENNVWNHLAVSVKYSNKSDGEEIAIRDGKGLKKEGAIFSILSVKTDLCGTPRQKDPHKSGRFLTEDPHK